MQQKFRGGFWSAKDYSLCGRGVYGRKKNSIFSILTSCNLKEEGEKKCNLEGKKKACK